MTNDRPHASICSGQRPVAGLLTFRRHRRRPCRVGFPISVVIEQAEGMIAERHRVDMERAFSQLRSHARDNNRRLAAVATDVVAGNLDL